MVVAGVVLGVFLDAIIARTDPCLMVSMPSLFVDAAAFKGFATAVPPPVVAAGVGVGTARGTGAGVGDGTGLGAIVDAGAGVGDGTGLGVGATGAGVEVVAGAVDAGAVVAVFPPLPFQSEDRPPIAGAAAGEAAAGAAVVVDAVAVTEGLAVGAAIVGALVGTAGAIVIPFTQLSQTFCLIVAEM